MREVAELNGDGIAAELRDAIHALNDALGNPVGFRPVDWSLERREAGPAALEEGVETVRSLGAAMKYPTVTESLSPNQVLRDELDLAVIHRPCRTYPGVSTNYTGQIDLHVVRVATGGTYEDAGKRIGYHSAVSIRIMERTPVEHAAHFAFQTRGTAIDTRSSRPASTPSSAPPTASSRTSSTKSRTNTATPSTTASCSIRSSRSSSFIPKSST